MGEHDWKLAYGTDVREGDTVHAVGDIPRTVKRREDTPVYNPVIRLHYEDGSSRTVGKFDRLLIHDPTGEVADRLARIEAEAAAWRRDG